MYLKKLYYPKKMYLKNLKIKEKNVSSPHEAIVSRWEAVFLLRGCNETKQMH